MDSVIICIYIVVDYLGSCVTLCNNVSFDVLRTSSDFFVLAALLACGHWPVVAMRDLNTSNNNRTSGSVSKD